MDIKGGEILIFKSEDTEKRWRVSKVDGNVVKIFEEDGTYKQMPYTYIKELYDKGYIRIEKLPDIW